MRRESAATLVLIPEAREGAAPEVVDVIADPATAYARAAVVFNRIRLEREPDTLEPTFLARLWRRMFRGR
jgi:hypothetical protein